MTLNPASTSCFAVVGVRADRCSIGLDSARKCKVTGDIFSLLKLLISMKKKRGMYVFKGVENSVSFLYFFHLFERRTNEI